jgi:hypothetical protein
LNIEVIELRESAIEKRFVKEIQKIGGKAPKWVSPGNRGVPDRIVILPGGRTVYVEMKAPGKPLGPLQQKWSEILRSLGHEVYKIDSHDDINRFIAKAVHDEV